MKKLLVSLLLILGLASVAEAAPAYRSGSLAVYAATESTTSRTLTAGAGWASGDVLFGVAAGTNITSVTMPAGWTQVTSCSGSQGIFQWVCGYIVRGGSNPSLTWTVGTSNSRYVEIFAIALTGVDNATPITGSAVGIGFNGNVSVVPDPPSASIGSGALVVTTGGKRSGPLDDTDDLWTPPSGYTILATTVPSCTPSSATCGTHLALAYSSTVLSDTQDPAAFTGNATGTFDGWHGATIGFKDAGGGGGGGGSVIPSLMLGGVGLECEG
jgi:hypothetical protein